MGRKISLSSFSEADTDTSVQEQGKTPASSYSELKQAYTDIWGKPYEKVENIDTVLLKHYKDKNGEEQPFILNDEKINQIMASAEDIGFITPLIVRRIDDNKYQIIAGHHRYEAAVRLNMLSVPCIVRTVSDDEVFQIVAESNIQRDKTLPSEYGRIFHAYMKKRDDTDMTAAEIAAKFGVSKRTMYRYMSVADLSICLQKYADDGRIQLNAADIISTFSEENQKGVLCYLEHSGDKKITVSVANKFAKMIEEYGGEDVPYHEFTKFLAPKPVQRYKSSIYNNLSLKYKIEKSEQELDELTEKLLTEYFESISR